jgi:hypothetical protein
VDDARVRLDLVRARDDDDVIDGALPQPPEDGVQQNALLRRAEAGRRSSC